MSLCLLSWRQLYWAFPFCKGSTALSPNFKAAECLVNTSNSPFPLSNGSICLSINYLVLNEMKQNE
jgi:hypothetical protein